MERPVLGYTLATGQVSSLSPSRMDKRQRSCSEMLVSVPGGDLIWLLVLAYASMGICSADCRTANCKKDDVPAEVHVPSVDVPEMNDLAILLGKCAGRIQNVVSVDSLLVAVWGQYRGDPSAIILCVPRTSLEVFGIGFELLSSHIALYVRLRNAGSSKSDPQAARETAGAKLAGACSAGGGVIQFRKR